jgi:hypothetical protein
VSKGNIAVPGPRTKLDSGSAGIDLVAIVLPEITGADPTVLPTSLLIDDGKMKEFGIGVGTEVLSVGYLYGYSGQKANFPMAKFGHVSVMSDESWFSSPSSHLVEQGYVLDLSNAPGLSGAPVFTHGMEFVTNPFRYRELPPYLIGVVKALMLAISVGAITEVDGGLRAYLGTGTRKTRANPTWWACPQNDVVL